LESQIILKGLGAIKPKGLNRIARIGYGHLCMREENLSISVIRSRKSMDNVDSGIQDLNPIEPRVFIGTRLNVLFKRMLHSK
jgi:hypothetical protein